MEAVFIQELNGYALQNKITDFLRENKIKKENIVSISYATENSWGGGYKHNVIIIFEK